MVHLNIAAARKQPWVKNTTFGATQHDCWTHRIDRPSAIPDSSSCLSGSKKLSPMSLSANATMNLMRSLTVSNRWNASQVA